LTEKPGASDALAPESSAPQDQLLNYRAVETLRNGKCVEIRALHPEDRNALLAAIGGMSDRSVYRRFFALKRDFSEKEISTFLEIDFRNHVALVAVNKDGQEGIIAGARYVVIAPGQAEVACAVVDAYQGQGLGKLIIRRLCAIAKVAGLRELVAEVLPENLSMLKVFEASGLPVRVLREAGVLHVVIQLSSEAASMGSTRTLHRISD
jgi:RimJ/RimL family protein N-acetyltransferase